MCRLALHVYVYCVDDLYQMPGTLLNLETDWLLQQSSGGFILYVGFPLLFIVRNFCVGGKVDR